MKILKSSNYYVKIELSIGILYFVLALRKRLNLWKTSKICFCEQKNYKTWPSMIHIFLSLRFPCFQTKLTSIDSKFEPQNISKTCIKQLLIKQLLTLKYVEQILAPKLASILNILMLKIKDIRYITAWWITSTYF